MKIKKTKFKNLLIFYGVKFLDSKGKLRELMLQKYLKKKIIFTVFSKSKKRVLRGFHIQKKNMQGKFLTVLKGKILDVVVDCRKNSKTFGKSSLCIQTQNILRFCILKLYFSKLKVFLIFFGQDR